MTITCTVMLNGQPLYPELPITRTRIFIGNDTRQLNGQLRRAHRATKMAFSLVLRDADETDRAAWAAVAIASASMPFVDELGVTRTVLVMAFADDLSRTVPAAEGGLSTTGAGYYDLRVDLEEV